MIDKLFARSRTFCFHFSLIKFALYTTTVFYLIGKMFALYYASIIIWFCCMTIACKLWLSDWSLSVYMMFIKSERVQSTVSRKCSNYSTGQFVYTWQNDHSNYIFPIISERKIFSEVEKCTNSAISIRGLITANFINNCTFRKAICARTKEEMGVKEKTWYKKEKRKNTNNTRTITWNEKSYKDKTKNWWDNNFQMTIAQHPKKKSLVHLYR